ncbi:hypothetical protein CTI12_AA224780 [Artemisia annua]|uniref:Symplekin C-terminal domain-containing protein n=1 Tax=Artemisia annua TaxID=35608 RepID=A0A2U1NQR2_ARTAN|nr:hypothetical protein CTI12_AA224780 [Artemisia annua]
MDEIGRNGQNGSNTVATVLCRHSLLTNLSFQRRSTRPLQSEYQNRHHSSSAVVRGTIGCAAPDSIAEYGLGSKVSRIGDMYSFGILLLEMITSKKPTDTMFGEGLSLHIYAKAAMGDGGHGIVDPALLNDDGKLAPSTNKEDVRTYFECLGQRQSKWTRLRLLAMVLCHQHSQGSAYMGPALTPAEVLVAIHDISPEKDGVPLKKVMDACSACIEQRTVLTQQVLAKALSQMVLYCSPFSTFKSQCSMLRKSSFCFYICRLIKHLYLFSS